MLIAHYIRKGLQPLIEHSTRYTASTDEATRACIVDKSVDYVCEELPDAFAQVVESPDWSATLLHYAPEIAPHIPYLTLVRGEWLALPVEDAAATPSQTPIEKHNQQPKDD